MVCMEVGGSKHPLGDISGAEPHPLTLSEFGPTTSTSWGRREECGLVTFGNVIILLFGYMHQFHFFFYNVILIKWKLHVKHKLDFLCAFCLIFPK